MYLLILIKVIVISRCNYIKHLFNHVHAKVFGIVQGYKFSKLETSKQNDLLLLNELSFFRDTITISSNSKIFHRLVSIFEIAILETSF